MFCQQCGKEILENAKFCSYCGTPTDDIKEVSDDVKTNPTIEKKPTIPPKPKKEPAYVKYRDNVRKINTLTLITQVLSILLALGLLFLPIYQRTYEPDLDDIESIEDLEEALQNDGYLTENFSLVEDFSRIVEYLVESNNDEMGYMLIVCYAMFPLFEILFSIILVGTIISKLWNEYKDRENIDKSTMLKYNEMRLTGTRQVKANFFQKQSIMSIMLYAIFDVLYVKMFDSVFSKISKLEVRYMQTFSGVSGYVFVLAIVLISFIVFKSMAKNQEKEMLLLVTEERYHAEE